MVFKVSHS
jgi:hypothetical protein